MSWFEEPVSSDDLRGLRLLRDNGPAGMAIAAGEYGYDAAYFERMLAAGSVDVLQADVTRCGGVTGLLGVAALCRARNLPSLLPLRSDDPRPRRDRDREPRSTSSTSTTTLASSGCSSTVCPSFATERYGPTSVVPEWGLS